MGLREAIKFLKEVVDRKGAGGRPAVYTFHDGWVHARGPAIAGAYPVPHILGTFGLAANDLDSAIFRMKEEPAVSPGDGAMVLKSGRLKSSIELFEVPEPEVVTRSSNATIPVPAKLITAIEKSLPFASHEGTWQRGVELRSGLVRTISNVHGCRVEVPGLEVDGAIVLTDDVAKFIVGRDELPVEWTLGADSISLFWLNGAWARCQLSVHSWPEVVDTAFLTADEECPLLVTDEWREALADLQALGDEYVDVGSLGMTGKSAHATHEVEFATGASKPSRWKMDGLANVLKVAEAWNPDAERAAFRGDGLRGMIGQIRR